MSKVPPIPCNFKVGDKVTYTNDNGVKFPGKMVMGFCEKIDPDFLPEKFIYLNLDCHWMPVDPAHLNHEHK